MLFRVMVRVIIYQCVISSELLWKSRVMANRNDYLYSTPLGGSPKLYYFSTSSSLLIIADFRKPTATCEGSIKETSEGCFVALNTNQLI